MPTYSDSKELAILAEKVVRKHHPALAAVNIGFLFRDKAPVSRTRVVLGMTIKVDDRNHVYSGKDAIVEIGADTWSQLDDELREILIDHELHHIGVELDEQGHTVLTDNGRPKIFMKPHDIEEFGVIIDRYGDTHKKFRQALEGFNAAAAAASKKTRDAKPAKAEG